MKSILLVDDEALIRAEFGRTLEGFGFRVEAADTVEAALASIQEAQFDMILLEFNLRSERSAHPRTGSGLQLVRQLRDLGITVPVLILTTMEGDLYETASLDAGADDFIEKTITIPRLVARLRAHTHRYEQDFGEAAAPGSGRSASESHRK